jgi:hypothetical protein
LRGDSQQAEWIEAIDKNAPPVSADKLTELAVWRPGASALQISGTWLLTEIVRLTFELRKCFGGKYFDLNLRDGRY